MKKFLSILLVVILLVGQVPGIGLAVSDNSKASSTDIIINKVETDKSRIRANDEFILSLTLENNSNKDLKSLAIGIEKSPSFRLSDTGSKKTFEFKEGEKQTIVDFKLIYNGGEDIELPIKLYYEIDGAETSFSDYVSINQAQAEKEPEAPDESKYQPNLSVVSSKTILGESGSTISLPVEIKNTGNSIARDISTTLELGEDSPFYIEGRGHASSPRLRSGESQSLSFRLKADKKAEGKTYPINVKFRFYNDLDKLVESSDTIYVKITDDKRAAQLVINRVDIKPGVAIEPGGLVTVGFEIENKGDSPAKDIKLSLKGLTNEGFSLVSGLNSQSIPFLEKGKPRYIFFQLKSSRKLTSGNHELEMALSYKNINNQESLDENKFFIPIASNKNQSSNLIMENLTYPTGSLGINKDVNISFTLRNQGQSPAKNIIIKAESTDMSGLVPKSVSVIKLDSIEAGGSKKIDYQFLTTKGAETKNYPINISVQYGDESSSEEVSTLDQFLGVFVLAPDEPGDPIKSTPRLIIDRYDFQPNLVRAGENFQMNLSFFNTNSSKTVKNIKIFLTAEANSGTDQNNPSSGSSVFTPVNSSNTFYIDSIAPKGRVDKTITMFTIPDAVAKTHMITANFEYEDNQGEEYTATELIGVPVVQQSRLEIGEVAYSMEAYIGESTPISVEFYNTGKVTLYNMMVRLEGDFQTESGSYYIGNFQNGSSEYFEGYIIPSEPGPLEGEVVFTYEDSTGEEQEVRKDFNLNVLDMSPMDEFPDDFEPLEEGPGGFRGFLTSKWLWGSILILAGGFGGFKFYKKKKQEKEDEELAFHE